MRTARRLTLVGALLAIAWGASRLLVPVQVDVGSAVYGTLDELLPGSVEETKLSCGNVLAPREFGRTLADTPERLLHRECARAVDAAKGAAVAWMAFGGLTAFLGITLLRDPRRAGGRTGAVDIDPVGPPLGPPPMTRPSGWVEARPAAPPSFHTLASPILDGVSEPQLEDGNTVPSGRRTSPVQRAALATVGVLGVLVGFVAWAARTEPSTSRAVVNAPSNEPAVVAELPAFDPVEQACIPEAMAQSDELYDLARAASERDRDEAIINLDGDSSYVEYSVSLEMVDVRECPDLFQGAFRTWVAAWGAYGSDRANGGGNAERNVRVLQAAYDALLATAAEVDVDLPRRTWTVTTAD